jgi:hypothetical protein
LKDSLSKILNLLTLRLATLLFLMEDSIWLCLWNKAIVPSQCISTIISMLFNSCIQRSKEVIKIDQKELSTMRYLVQMGKVQGLEYLMRLEKSCNCLWGQYLCLFIALRVTNSGSLNLILSLNRDLHYLKFILD